ncbi:GTPase_rho, putative [Entamoeba dispar SAW760]|uniref:small monomeric GTPase n=1 Tax=Entamoeba dispar (strain ATCC PRA-260 / SAW760) TaxID=370354 RepID=B0EN44_ENTDS|nr:GTPase_rho, putative [Entamoeba dispar SAW760]EDR24069.1 GTPase_rho, putative [Entamoeba dispar SAW760]|eukprot:EDR24069.1 GTPase_rho, putative [Entamoeba dispar SAW760]
MGERRTVKIVMVGDGAVGKTALCSTFVNNQFPQDYIPTVFDNFSRLETVDGEQVTMSIWDTAGQEEYDRLRPMSYPDTNMLIICFAIDSKSSFVNISQRWIPEIKHFCPDVPFILVATKSDLRQSQSTIEKLRNEGKALITEEEIKSYCKKLKAAGYIECSALENKNVGELFYEAVRKTKPKLHKDKKKKGGLFGIFKKK